MDIINNIAEIRKIVKKHKKEGKTVGFVPTMGFLHEGHASLIEKARKENDIVVVSIFVNPIQFGANEDLDKYPRDMERDKKLVSDVGGDYIFAPEVKEMYPEKLYTYVDVEKLSEGLCGAKREGHFRGVATVVTKLFNIVSPDRAYFGQKDAQQVAVIRKMVKDLNVDVEVVSCPIIREEDGLAKSSRNTYLNSDERAAALVLSKSLEYAKKLIGEGELSTASIIESMKEFINKEPLAKVDYIEIVDRDNLNEVETIERPVLIAIAVYIGKTRLIDNCVYTSKEEK
ncbi:MAG: pantoate--beta-alanine ligase [Clostridiaceae bacterium]